MHDTQKENLNNAELCASFQKDESVDDFQKEINFESIKIDSYYFQSQSKDKNFTMDFMGDIEESTEIDSLMFPLNYTANSSKLQFGEENTETDEILAILKQNSTMARNCNIDYPERKAHKKLSLTGKVLHTEFNAEPVKGPISPLPIRPRCIPQRVSKPIYRNNDSLLCINKQINNNYIDKNSPLNQF